MTHETVYQWPRDARPEHAHVNSKPEAWVDVLPHTLNTHLRLRDLVLATHRGSPADRMPWHFGKQHTEGACPEEEALGVFMAYFRIALDPKRLVFMGRQRYIFHGLPDKPQVVTCHRTCHTYAVAVKESEEIVMRNRFRNACYVPRSLRHYDLASLEHPEMHPALKDMHRRIFS